MTLTTPGHDDDTLELRGSDPTRAPRSRVLLVDDEIRVLEGIAPLLRRAFDVVTTTSPVEALELARTGAFAAVVSDQHMPVMTGVTLLEQVKRVSPATARVLLTGRGDVPTAISAINQASVHRFLVKPCKAGAVVDALRDAIAANSGLDAASLADLGRKATLGDLAGAIGHEMGNALLTLEGSLSSVRNDASGGRLVSGDDISLVELAKQRLVEQTAQLRDLARPHPLTIADVDLVRVVSGAVHVMQRCGAVRGARITTSFPHHAIMARADARSVEGVLLNLIKNAVEAIGEQALADVGDGLIPDDGQIMISVTSAPTEARILVSDNGCGIAPDRIERLFEPRRSTKGHRGSGLGLGIARAVLERQGGRLTVDSSVGVGTQFTVHLPNAFA